MTPLLTLQVHDSLVAAARNGSATLECSLDLDRSRTVVEVGPSDWTWNAQRYPYLETCNDRTIYYWTGEGFEALARYSTSLVKLVPTQWGPPTFEIDGIKMLPTAHVSPYEDARHKVALIQPRGKAVLDTCGGLGYFAAWCVRGQAKRIASYEKNLDVIWLRTFNPWSPEADPASSATLTLQQGDVGERILSLPDASLDAALHDPPRFGIAGELYSEAFYRQLARVLKRKSKLFHYTGEPNKRSRGRDLAAEVMQRLRHAGFAAEPSGDGVLAVKR